MRQPSACRRERGSRAAGLVQRTVRMCAGNWSASDHDGRDHDHDRERDHDHDHETMFWY